MAVIKCSNCENEILDTEIVCPYCDCPISETIKKMKQDDLESYSVSSIDGLTGKIPAIKDTEEPKLATSSDFEKEKAAILKDLEISLSSTDEASDKETEAADAPDQDIPMDKTVKISRESIASGELKKAGSAAATIEKPKSAATQKAANAKKGKPDSRYIIFGITIVVIVLVVYIIWGIVGSITDKFAGKKKGNKMASVTSSATELEKDMGYKFHSETLTITDDKVMRDYTSSIETPWYEYINEIKYVTIGNEVTKIGDHAFEGFDGIVDLTLSSKLETIGEYAFKGCDSLEKIKIPDNNNLDEIGDGAFESCKKLQDITGYTKKADFEPTVSKIGSRAFANCSSLKELKLPMYTEIGDGAFDGLSDEFIIICESSGDVYEYAKENDIPTKLSFEGEITEVKPEAEPDETENSEKPKNDEPKEDKPKEDNPSQPQNPSEEKPAESSKPTLSELMNQLNTAATQEEKDRILAEIDKLMQ